MARRPGPDTACQGRAVVPVGGWGGVYQAFGEARDVLEGVIRKLPKVEVARIDLGNTLNRLGSRQIDDKRYERAIRSLDRAVEVLGSLAEEANFPANPLVDSLILGALAEWSLGHEAACLERLAGLETRLRPSGGRNNPRAMAEVKAVGGYLAWKLGMDTPRHAVERIEAAMTRVGPLSFKNPRWFPFLARYHSLRAALAGVPGSGRSAEQGQAGRDTAVESLRRSSAVGQGVEWVYDDPGFSPLVGDPGWNGRKIDPTFPIDPFPRP